MKAITFIVDQSVLVDIKNWCIGIEDYECHFVPSLGTDKAKLSSLEDNIKENTKKYNIRNPVYSKNNCESLAMIKYLSILFMIILNCFFF
jgi:hypothetical protein